VGPARITYRHLDHRANHLAHLPRERRVSAGSTVGILLDRSEDTYVALLGLLKAGGAYVPLDAAFPADRVRYIAEDAGFQDLVTTSASRDVTRDLPCAVVELDLVQSDLAASELRPNCVRTGR
jgi:non-ribosomal peptide synthetase component F